MVIAINRNSGVFDKATADQLNAAFTSVNKNIEAYETADLEYKEKVQLLGTNSNSFRCGNLVCIRDGFTVSKRLDSLTKVGELLVSVPYEVWTSGTTENNDSMIVRIYGQGVYMQGVLPSYPQKVYVCTDVVIPQHL